MNSEVYLEDIEFLAGFPYFTFRKRLYSKTMTVVYEKDIDVYTFICHVENIYERTAPITIRIGLRK